MLSSYIKTAARSILRNKLFSAINILGLAISMSVGLLIIGMLHDIFQYDQFHENGPHIYRVISQYQFRGSRDSDFMATTSLKAGEQISETFAQPEAVAILKTNFGGDITAGEKTVPLTGFWSNQDFLEVFTFALVEGDHKSALINPYSIILTETSAKKLFGSGAAIGKTVIRDKQEYTVTGVLKDIPFFSTIKFDMLASLSTEENRMKNKAEEPAWETIWDTYVFLLLPPETDKAKLQESLDKLTESEAKANNDVRIQLALEPLGEIMRGENRGNEIGAIIGKTTIQVFAALAFVVILSACFNYTNLSIARSLKRNREVGIRKVIGAKRFNLVTQFVVEALLISFFALALALVLFGLIRPEFLSIESSLQQLLKLEISPMLMCYYLVFAAIVGVVAGIFPALFFSKVNVSKILKDFSSSASAKKLTLRRVLIVFQYTLSIIFICGTIAMYRQYEYFINYDLGFNTDNILNISLQGNKAEHLRKDLVELPEVQQVSSSLLTPGIGHYWQGRMKYAGAPDDSISINFNTVDENYLPLHEHQILAGRNFQYKEFDSLETEVIVNEQALKRFNIANANAARAIGEVITIDNKKLTIIGVVRDFQYGKVIDRVGGPEVAFRYSHSNPQVLNVRLQSTNVLDTYHKIEKLWKRHDPVHPFEAKFYQQQIEQSFQGFRASVKVAGALTFLAIVIASLGLLGMVVFTTQSRLKEISIRKILGATNAKLLYLLAKGFLLMLSMAALIGFPLTILFFEKVAFPNFANHAPLSVIEMALGVVSILIIALLMIIVQSLKVASVNPADVLKAE